MCWQTRRTLNKTTQMAVLEILASNRFGVSLLQTEVEAEGSTSIATDECGFTSSRAGTVAAETCEGSEGLGGRAKKLSLGFFLVGLTLLGGMEVTRTLLLNNDHITGGTQKKWK